MSDPYVFVIMPCLNEERTLQAAANSLGFGGPSPGYSHATLFVVDNGSTDNTSAIAHQIQQQSDKTKVVVLHVEERGYLPPRIQGTNAALNFAHQMNLMEEDVLIVQADADTQYEAGYVEAVHQASRDYGRGTWFEGYSEYPNDFRDEYGDYIAACRETDAAFADLFADWTDDVVVTDNVCSYFLSDYLLWGGHQREYTKEGDEIYAESTRLFLKGKAHGARRIFVESAVAYHSARKILENPLLDFASAGFPRERSWTQWWLRTYPPSPLSEAYRPFGNLITPDIKATRIRHALGIFHFLPLHVRRTLSYVDGFSNQSLDETVANLLPLRTLDELRHRSGQFISDVMTLVDDASIDLLKEAQSNL